MVNKNILSPVNVVGVFSNERRYEFAIGNHIIESSKKGFEYKSKSENDVFNKAKYLLENARITNDNVILNDRSKTFVYDVKSGVLKFENTQISESALDNLHKTGQALAENVAVFKDIDKVLNKIVKLDFAEQYENQDYRITLMKNSQILAALVENKVTGIVEFKDTLSGSEAIALVEKTGENPSYFIREFLDKESAQKAVVYENKEKIKKILTFLKDSKETLLEAKETEKIIKAIDLLNNEIVRWESRL